MREFVRTQTIRIKRKPFPYAVVLGVAKTPFVQTFSTLPDFPRIRKVRRRFVPPFPYAAVLGTNFPVRLPSFIGIDPVTDSATIVGLGLVADTSNTAFSINIPAGLVVDQVPAVDSLVPVGSTVFLVISLGPPIPPPSTSSDAGTGRVIVKKKRRKIPPSAKQIAGPGVKVPPQVQRTAQTKGYLLRRPKRR